MECAGIGRQFNFPMQFPKKLCWWKYAKKNQVMDDASLLQKGWGEAQRHIVVGANLLAALGDLQKEWQNSRPPHDEKYHKKA